MTTFNSYHRPITFHSGMEKITGTRNLFFTFINRGLKAISQETVLCHSIHRITSVIKNSVNLQRINIATGGKPVRRERICNVGRASPCIVKIIEYFSK